MNQIELMRKIDAKRNGSFFGIKWHSNLNNHMKASAKNAGLLVTKEVETVVRKGIKYGNIKNVEVKGKGMPWAETINGHSGAFIKGKNGKTYIKLFSCSNIPKVIYKLNGIVINEEALKQLGVMQDSYWKKEKPIVMTIMTDNITEVK